MADYRSTLTGTQMDQALLDMAEHNSEAYAVGERNGIAVASDDVTYHNNARYYAQIASSQIVGDASSAVRWDTDQSEVLTDAQKAQARENINAASDSDVVKITAQTLTTAQQSQARANIMAGGSNRNLLDNPWFTVRQRGAGPFSSAGYTVDRWKIMGGNVVVTPRTPYGVNLNWTTACAYDQYLDIDPQILVGKTVTLSAMVDGVVYSQSAVYSASGEYVITITVGNVLFRLGYFTSTGRVFIRIGNAAKNVETDVNVDAIKLELGSVSTLANDVPPDYWQELDKCLYYFERITNNGSSPITIGAGFADGVNNLYVPVHIHRKRAGIATISTSGVIYAGQRSSNISVSSVTQYNSSPDGIITLLAVTPSSFTSNEYYRLALGAGAHIDFSADL